MWTISGNLKPSGQASIPCGSVLFDFKAIESLSSQRSHRRKVEDFVTLNVAFSNSPSLDKGSGLGFVLMPVSGNNYI